MNEIETNVSLNAEEIVAIMYALHDKAEQLYYNKDGYWHEMDEATKMKQKAIFATIEKLRKGLDKIEEADAKAA